MAKKAAAIDPEIYKCWQSPAYFISNYVKIIDAKSRQRIPFSLWPFQVQLVDIIHKNKKIGALKARQEGFSLVAAAYALHDMIFNPISRILVFSKDDSSAMTFLNRLKDMWDHLDPKFKVPKGEKDSSHFFSLNNGSWIQSFSSSADSGRGETASIAIIDEADFVPDFLKLMDSVEPTISDNGKLILISTVDKTTPQSGFKNIFRDAMTGSSEWVPVFAPWSARPDRDQDWYDREFKSKVSRHGSLAGGRDSMWQEFPATVLEALSPNSTDKRLQAEWLQKCFIQMEPMEQLPKDAPSIPGLKIYHLPERNPLENKVHYLIGADPAGGNPNSNDSAATILRRDTGEEVACLCGKIEPSVFAIYLDQLGRYYNDAELMVEVNNMGLTVLTELQRDSGLTRLRGHDKKVGWNSSVKGKIILYNVCADAFRNGEVLIHNFSSILQLSEIEGNTGKAPDEGLDDLADSVALALAGIVASLGRSFVDDIKPEINYYTAIPRAMTEMDSFMMGDQDRDRDDDQEISYSEIVENMIF